MLAGQLGAGLALSRLEPGLNVGVLILAAVLLDVLLWSFVLLGLERVVIPPDFLLYRQLAFVFPYSHELTVSLVWSGLAGLVFGAASRTRRSRIRIAAVVGVAVFSSTSRCTARNCRWPGPAPHTSASGSGTRCRSRVPWSWRSPSAGCGSICMAERGARPAIV